jgi:hypothetical protein
MRHQNRTIYILLGVLCFFLLLSSCDNKYETSDINGIDVGVDRAISMKTRSDILDYVRSVTPNDGLYIKGTKSLTFDSIMYSYLISIGVSDSLTADNLGILKAYGSYLSKHVFRDNPPVHYYVQNTGTYYKHDTTTIIFKGYTVHTKGIKASTESIGLFELNLIARFLTIQIEGIKHSGELNARIDLEKGAIKITFTIDSDSINLNNLRDTFTKVDPASKFLVFENTQIAILFKDENGNNLANGLYLK